MHVLAALELVQTSRSPSHASKISNFPLTMNLQRLYTTQPKNLKKKKNLLAFPHMTSKSSGVENKKRDDETPPRTEIAICNCTAK